MGKKFEYSLCRHPGEGHPNGAGQGSSGCQRPWIPDQVRDDELSLGYVGLKKSGGATPSCRTASQPPLPRGTRGKGGGGGDLAFGGSNSAKKTFSIRV